MIDLRNETDRIIKMYWDTVTYCYLSRNDYLDSTHVDAEEVIQRFKPIMDELKLLFARWRDEDVRECGEQLLDEVLNFEFGNWQDCMVGYQNEGANRDIRNGVQAARVQVKDLIEQLVKENSSEGVAADIALTWLGNAGELAELFNKLQSQGWIQLPRSYREYATRVRRFFLNEKGGAIDEDTLSQYMKPSSEPPVRPGVKFGISANPGRSVRAKPRQSRE